MAIRIFSSFQDLVLAIALLALCLVVDEPYLSAQTPEISPGGVVNAASFARGAPVAPGSIASVFGSGLASSTESATALPLPTTLGGATLRLNNSIAVPKFYAAPTQINIQVPWELAGQTQASLTDTVGGLTSGTQTVRLSSYAPGIFTVDGAMGAIVHGTSGQLVTASNPALLEEVVGIYATGLGDVTDRPATGAVSPSNPLARTVTTPQLTIGGVPASVQFSGLAPGFVGLYQINVQLPPNAPTGNAVPIVLTIGGISSNTVAIAIAPRIGAAGQVSVSPSSGAAGTQFSYQGSGFTDNFGVASHLRRPDGTEFPTLQIATNASGQFSSTINSTGFAAGTYQVWAIDNNTGISSNVASFTVQGAAGSLANTFTWPVDPGNASNGFYASCGDWPGDPQGCFWISADGWRDVQPFQKHLYSGFGYHLGADWNLGSGDADANLPVYAAADGTVSSVQSNVSGWGNIIFVAHSTPSGTYTSMYAHVNWKDSGPPSIGEVVTKGQQIAKIGNGNGLYPYHLHFELRVGSSTSAGPGYTQTVVTSGPQGQIDPDLFIAANRGATGTPDLVVYYPFEGSTLDQSGTGNQGTAFGGVRFVGGKIGQAAMFDGTTGYISVADNPSLRLATFTLSAWINPSAFVGGNRIVEKGNSNSYYLDVNSSARPVVGFFDGSYHDLIGPSSLQTNTWYFVAGTYDGTALRLYVNGTLVNTLPLSSAPFQTGQPLIIGWKFGGIVDDHFAGLIDELRVYKRALSATEIQELYGVAPPVSAGPKAYVNNYSSNSVSVIDTTTDAAIKTIPVGSGPGPIRLMPAGSRAYVGNYGANTVSIIDTATDTVSKTIQTGLGSCNIAVHPSGTKAYVTHQKANSVSVIDIATEAVMKTVPVGDQPCALAVSPNGAKVYVANQGAGSVSVISTTSDAVTKTIQVGSSPYPIVFTPDSSRAYVVNGSSNSVSVIDAANDSEIKKITVGAGPRDITIKPDGSKVYVVNDGGLFLSSVSVIATATDAIVKTVRIGGFDANVIVLAPNGGKAYVAHTGSPYALGDISVIDTTADNVTKSFAVGNRPVSIAFTSNGAKAYVANINSANVSVIDTTTDTEVKKIPVGNQPVDIAINP